MVTRFPQHSLSAWPWRGLRWMILAPHPDDETLGAGALIAQAASTGRLAGIVYLTDGSGSHPAPQSGQRKLVGIRKREAATALHRLTTSRALAPVHLGWKDAGPVQPGDPCFNRSARMLAALCVRWNVDALAVTGLHEPHCDHAAAATLAYAAQRAAKRRVLVAEYVVWAAPPDHATHRTIGTASMAVGRRRHALRAHRSQLTASQGPGFRLPADRQHMPARDILYLRRRA